MKALLFILVLLLSSCDKDSISVPTEQDFIVYTVDINGEAYLISNVDWWFESTPEVRYSLECDIDVCDTWEFPQGIEGAIFISGSHSVAFENDEYCAELFGGQRYFFIDKNIQQELIIEILYTGGICR